jgi:hypothetical protein
MALGAFNCVSNHARLLSVAEAGPSNLRRYLVADRGHFNWVARSHRLTRENSNAHTVGTFLVGVCLVASPAPAQ